VYITSSCGYWSIRRLPALVLYIVISTAASATSEFDQPWLDNSRALIIDPFVGNRLDWEQMARENRLVAIVHKATTGVGSVDPSYFDRRQEAIKRGYLWGSYHWGSAGDGVRQADFYIDTVKPAKDELIALDLEDVQSANLMGIVEAARFVSRVRERLGRSPLIYANDNVTRILSNSEKQSSFAGTRLWYARFLSRIPNFPKRIWTTYSIWQFSSEVKVQYRIPGTDSDIDVSVYNGSIDQLRREWPLSK
jgi:lysozyme